LVVTTETARKLAISCCVMRQLPEPSTRFRWKWQSPTCRAAWAS
jgi:hypothetical protein